MIVLHANIAYLRAIGMLLPAHQAEEKPSNLVFNFVYAIPLTMTIGGLIAYFFTNLSDMRLATASSYEIFGLSVLLSGFWIFVLQRKRIQNAIDQLQGVVNERQHSPIFRNYLKIEKRAASFSKKFHRFLFGIVSCCYFMPFIAATIQWLSGTYTNEIWFLPYKCVTPYDQHAPVGYLFTWVLECVGGFLGLAMSVGINCMYFSICWYVEGLMDDLMFSVRELDMLTSPKQVAQMRKEFRAVIEFHNSIISFLDNFNGFFQGIIFTTFALSCLWICMALMQLQYTIANRDVLFYQCLVTLCVVNSSIFTYCYFGHKVTTKFAEVADAVYVTNWYEYPMQQQRYLIFMLIRSQRPFHFTGYFISSCSLESYKSILETAFSYFMVLRAI